MSSLGTHQLHIYSGFSLSKDDLSTLSLLYAPLIGMEAVGLYLSLESLLERNNLKSETYTHQEIFDLFSLSEKKFLQARYQLEGIGLLSSYEKEDELVYSLCAPLSAKNFIKDATLGLYLYSKIGKDLFDKISLHFKLEKFDKSGYQNVTKEFSEIFTSKVNEDVSYSRFQYLLGTRPSRPLKTDAPQFSIDRFLQMIHTDCLESGVTKQFINQITNLAFVYAFDETQLANLYHESIGKTGLFDYKTLKKKANILYSYLHHQNTPKLSLKEENMMTDVELADYLSNSSARNILNDLYPSFPEKYLMTIEDIYSKIDLPRGVLNCMIIRVLKDKNGELPGVAYFKKVSETWIHDNIFTVEDAIAYVTHAKVFQEESEEQNYSTGGPEML